MSFLRPNPEGLFRSKGRTGRSPFSRVTRRPNSARWRHRLGPDVTRDAERVSLLESERVAARSRASTPAVAPSLAWWIRPRPKEQGRAGQP